MAQLLYHLSRIFPFQYTIKANKRFIGAFIWDWTDGSLLTKNKDGKDYWSYGGDFRDFITLNIDHKQMGVGGDDSWSMAAVPHKEFRLPSKNYNYSFVLRPITKRKNYINHNLPPKSK